MKSIGAALCFLAAGSAVFSQGTVNFVNTPSTTVRTNAIGLGGTAGKTATFVAGNNSRIFYYALFTAPLSVTNLSATDLLTPTWTFTGLYATNITSGRLSGGANGATLQGWPPASTNSYAIAGWSATVAGSDWSAVVSQLSGATFDQGVWSGANWQGSSAGGFFGVSAVGYGIAGGGPNGLPPFGLFGVPSTAGVPLSTGFDLYVISGAAPTQVLPQFTLQPTNVTAIAGDDVTFYSQAYGTPSPGFEWYFNGTNITDGSSSNLSLVNVQPSDAGIYYVRATNTAGYTASSNASLTVVSTPVITVQPQDLALGLGETADFSVTAIGPAPLSYQWRFNGADIGGATTSSYSIAGADTIDAGDYTVVVSNSYGAITSSVAVLRVPVEGTISFVNTFPTAIRTNASGLGGGVGYPGSSNSFPVLFYYALFTAPPGVSYLDPADLLGTNWTFTGIYATNAIAPGRLSGGVNVSPLRGWPPQATNAFAVAGWSTDVAGRDWSAVAAQLAGAWLANGVWYGPNWSASSQSGYFGISAVGVGAAGGGTAAVPPFALFGRAPNAQGTPITTPTDLYPIRQGSGPMGAAPVRFTPDGFQINLSGEPGHVYEVLVSTDLASWSSIGIVTNANGQVRFTDPGAGSGSRAYRARLIQ